MSYLLPPLSLPALCPRLVAQVAGLNHLRGTWEDGELFFELGQLSGAQLKAGSPAQVQPPGLFPAPTSFPHHPKGWAMCGRPLLLWARDLLSLIPSLQVFLNLWPLEELATPEAP